MGGNRRIGATLVALMAGACALQATPASAATFTVACSPESTVAGSYGGITGLRQAIAAANALAGADTVNLANGCTYAYGNASTTAGFALPNITQSLEINGNGSTIQNTAPATTSLGLIVSNATGTPAITLNDLTLKGGNQITNGAGGAAVWAFTATTLTLNNVTATGNRAGTASTAVGSGGAILATNSTTTITNSHIDGNTASLGGGIATNGGTLTLKDSTVNANTATFTNTQTTSTALGGGGIYALGTAVTVDGGSVNDNRATSTGSSAANVTSAAQGGGIYVANANNVATAPALTVKGGAHVDGNAASATGTGPAGNGGGILTQATPVTLREGSTVSNNSATQSGGGVVVTTGRAPGGGAAQAVTIDGSTVQGNSAANGGGVFAFTGSIAVANGGTLSANTATGIGGGVYSFGAPVDVGDASITDNRSTGSGSAGSGGGIYATFAPVTLRHTTLTGNSTAGAGGGGVSLVSNANTPAALSITGRSTLADNHAASGVGGAVATSATSAPITITDSTVADNSAAIGGGINDSGSALNISSSTLVNNASAAWGGAINLAGAPLTITLSSLERNSAGNAGFGAGLTTASSDVTITRSSIIGNTGGLFGTAAFIGGGTSTIENTTVARNTTAPSSNNTNGGLLVTSAGSAPGRVDVKNTTWSDNGLGGSTAPGASLVAWSNSSASNTGPASIHLHNTVVADSDSGAGLGCAGIKNPSPATVEPANIVDDGGNAEWPTTGCPGAVHADTKLAPLASDSGQVTSSMRPKPGSSAIDIGTGACPATDQRGAPRPQGPACDAGAYETPAAPDTTASLIGSSPTKDPRFALGSPDASAASFECRRDNAGAWVACSDPWSAEPPAFSDGAHSVQVRALTADGYTDPTPANVAFVVDHTAPAVQITPLGTTADTTPDVTFTATDANLTSVHCVVDGVDQGACTSPYTTPVLSPGTHTVAVVATDTAGNVGSATQTVTVDTAPPNTVIDSGPTGVWSTTDTTTNDQTPTFAFHSTKSGSTFQCKVDGGAFAACTSPYTVAPALGDGPHTFQVRAIDSVGNVDPTPAVSQFTVSPSCSLVSISILGIRICLLPVYTTRAVAAQKVAVASYEARLVRNGRTSIVVTKQRGRAAVVRHLRKVTPGAYAIRVTGRSTAGVRLGGYTKVMVTKERAARFMRMR